LLRGLDQDCIVIGDFWRFTNPRQLMAYLGLVPSAHLERH